MAIVDRRIARGAARTALRELMDESAKVHSGSNLQLKGNSRRTRTRLLDAMRDRLSPLALHVVSNSKVGYGGGVASITLSTHEEHNATIDHGVIAGVRSLELTHIYQDVSIQITEHAIQRINQRLYLLDIGGVRRAFKPASILLVVLSYALITHYEGARQISVPFFGGALRCDVANSRRIIVKTFVPEPAKWEAGLVDGLDSVYMAMTPDRIDRLMWLPYAVQLLEHVKADQFASVIIRENIQVADAVEKILRKYSWITESYMERSDPVGTAWEKARTAVGKGTQDPLG
jgi:hypothetical protein